jgi:hypothetical protein
VPCNRLDIKSQLRHLSSLTSRSRLLLHPNPHCEEGLGRQRGNNNEYNNAQNKANNFFDVSLFAKK